MQMPEFILILSLVQIPNVSVEQYSILVQLITAGLRLPEIMKGKNDIAFQQPD